MFVGEVPADWGHYDIKKSFVANLNTDTLRQMVKGQAGESSVELRQAREELKARRVKT